MSADLRAAASEALEELGSGESGGEVQRITVDVEVEGNTEMVSLVLRDGMLSWSTTGEPDGPHVRAALRWLADGGAEPTRGALRTAEGEEPRVSWTPPEPAAEGFETNPRERLADALDDVVTTVVRTGVSADGSVSIAESLERLRKEAPLPTPSGIARWVGRLRSALERDDVVVVARLLEGAGYLADALRETRPTRAVRRRVVSWTGASGERGAIERLSDRTMVEIARESLPTLERGGIERRYLVDLHNGEIFREERSRTAPKASVGPCPRLVQVGLAEVEDGASPRHIRLMQYTVTPTLSTEDLRRVATNGYRRFAALADRYREWMAEHPGQSEPFAIVVPKRWSLDPDPIAYDDEGAPLAFARADDPPAVEVLGQYVKLVPLWVAGRLVDADGTLMMVPAVVALPEGSASRLLRLR